MPALRSPLALVLEQYGSRPGRLPSQVPHRSQIPRPAVSHTYLNQKSLKIGDFWCDLLHDGLELLSILHLRLSRVFDPLETVPLVCHNDAEIGTRRQGVL